MYVPTLPAAPVRRVCMLFVSALMVITAAQAQQRSQTPASPPNITAETPPAAAPEAIDDDGSTSAQAGRFPLRMINGMESVRFDAFRVVVYRGSATDNTGRGLIQLPKTLTIDIRNTGVLGRDDVATPDDVAQDKSRLVADAAQPNGYRAVYAPGHMHAGLPLAGWYHVVYMSADKLAGTVMLTRQQSVMRTDRPGDARPPAGYTYRRLSPAVHYFDPAIGFRPMVCAGWPKPTCNWTRLTADSNFRVLNRGTSTTPALVDATSWVPPTGRLLKLQAVVTSTGGSGGAYLRTLANAQGELLIGHANTGGRAVTFFEVTPNSKGTFAYRVDEGVTLDLYAVGFTMLQPF
jgi:hypothetical protein